MDSNTVPSFHKTESSNSSNRQRETTRIVQDKALNIYTPSVTSLKYRTHNTITVLEVTPLKLLSIQITYWLVNASKVASFTLAYQKNV